MRAQLRDMFPSAPILVIHYSGPATGGPKKISWEPPSVGYHTNSLAGLDAEEIMKSAGHLCNSCLTVSRDITCLYYNPEESPEKVGTFEWKVLLESLLEAVENGCQFCTLMTRRYFARDVVYSWPHKGVKNAVGCCGSTSKEEIASAAFKSVETLRILTRSHPGAAIGMIAEPIDYTEVDGGKRLSKVRFTALKSDVDGSTLQKELRIGASDGLSITIEVFARPGLSTSNIGVYFQLIHF